jgi:hypothetical protein
MAAGQPDVELLARLGSFTAERRWCIQKSHFCGWSTWVSKQEIRLGGGIRSGRTSVDAMETVTKRVKRSKNNQAHIGVARCDFGISDLHPQVAKGDGRTLISIGG